MAPLLLACSGCGRYAKASSPACPVCGEALRRPDGTVPRTAAALLLGLATTAMACSSTIETAASGGAGGTGGSNIGGMGGQAGSTSTTTVTEYGPAPTTGNTSSSSTAMTHYGPAPTTSGGGGAGGQGGAGGR